METKFKRCKVIILPVGEEYKVSSSRFQQPVHYYIVSDDEIKEGDWIMSQPNSYPLHNISGGFQEYPDTNGCKKIIASTDKLLGLPQPSESFRQKYVEKYNKGNKIREVMVEYYYDDIEVYKNEKIQKNTDNYIPKVNHKDNTITIKKVKDSWSKYEVIEIANKAFEYARGLQYKTSTRDFKSEFDKWIEENL